jgi:hypothetical protein
MTIYYIRANLIINKKHMKKLFTTLALSAMLSLGAFAQHCSITSIAITPGTGTTPGFSPPAENQPCMIIGQAVSDTIYFTNFDSTATPSGIRLYSLKIDSISNLPSGTCWVSNKVNNTFGPRENGVIYVQGTNNGLPGQYKLRIIVTLVTNLGTIGPVDAEAFMNLRYYLRSTCAGSACTPVDTVLGKTQAFIAYAPCLTSTASVSPTGQDTICQGASALLTAFPSGYSYRWSDATHSSTQSITVSTAGSYQVTVYNTTDTSISAPTVVVVSPIPSATTTLSGPATICQGDTADIAAPQGAGYRYHWSNNVTTRVLYATTSGSYTVTVTNANGCSAVSAPQTINVNTPPANTITSSGLVLTAQPAISYQWYLNGNQLGGQINQTITATQNGNYTVRTTGANGCSSISNIITITSVGIYDLSASASLHLYPNPNQGVFTLEAAGNTGNYYEINDQLGRLVQKKLISAETSLVDVSSQQAGIYYLTIKNTKQNQTIRFVIIK